MAAPTNTYKHADAIGIREDLDDLVTNISPVDTQFFKSCGKQKAEQIKHEWLTDSLRAAAQNAQAEGDEPSATAVTAATRSNNYCQTQAVTFLLSEIVQAANSAGGVTKESYQTAKFSKELAKDIEWAFLRETQATSDPYRMKGALNFCTTNLDKAGDATLNANGTVTGGTPRDLVEQMIKNIMQNIFTAGGDPTKIYCGPFQKDKMSTWVHTQNYRQLVEKDKVGTNVDIYVTSFGNLSIVPHRIMPTDVLFIVDEDYWDRATLIATHKQTLAKTARGDKYDISVCHTLVARAENANGRITDLTTN